MAAVRTTRPRPRRILLSIACALREWTWLSHRRCAAPCSSLTSDRPPSSPSQVLSARILVCPIAPPGRLPARQVVRPRSARAQHARSRSARATRARTTRAHREHAHTRTRKHTHSRRAPRARGAHRRCCSRGGACFARLLRTSRGGGLLRAPASHEPWGGPASRACSARAVGGACFARLLRTSRARARVRALARARARARSCAFACVRVRARAPTSAMCVRVRGVTKPLACTGSVPSPPRTCLCARSPS